MKKNTPFHQLFEFLKKVRYHLLQQEITDSNIIDKLLVICILIKFLEEIKTGNGTHTLFFIYQKHQVENFADALKTGKSISILEELGSKLNGKIFDYFTEQKENESEQELIERNTKIKEKLRQTDLSTIADFISTRANSETGELEFDKYGQLKLSFNFQWEQYNFKYLPIELISSIYEYFLQEDALSQTGRKARGIVYTPPFVVNFLVDEVMPLDKPELLRGENV